MNQSDLLDILIGAIIVLFALIGFWQGIGRSLLYLCGTLLGSELALWWADDLGGWLSDWLPLDESTGRLVAATAMIVTSMIVIGAGFSPLIWRYPRELRSRIGGLLTGAILGAITLGLILRYYFLFLQAEAQGALGDTRLAMRLWDDFQWVVLASVLTLGIMVVIGWILGAPEIDRGPVPPLPARQANPTNYRPPEDLPQLNRASYGAPPVQASTIATNPEPAAFASDRGVPMPAPVSEAESARVAEAGRGARSGYDTVGYEVTSVIRDSPEFEPQRAAAVESVMYAAEGALDRRASSGICPNCGMLLRKGDSFCPDCGFPLGG